MEDSYRIAETINFPEEEEKILKFWTEKKIFENCLKQSKDKPRLISNQNTNCFDLSAPIVILDTLFTMVHHLQLVYHIMVIF